MKSNLVSNLCRLAPLIIGVDPTYFVYKYDQEHVHKLLALLSWEKQPFAVDYLAPFLYPQWLREKGSVSGYKRYIFQSRELFKVFSSLFFIYFTFLMQL